MLIMTYTNDVIVKATDVRWYESLEEKDEPNYKSAVLVVLWIYGVSLLISLSKCVL